MSGCASPAKSDSNEISADDDLFNSGISSRDVRTVAFKAYSVAAWKNIADAQYALGRCYHDGIGVEKSRSLAHHWYSKASVAGYSMANIALHALKKEKADQ